MKKIFLMFMLSLTSASAQERAVPALDQNDARALVQYLYAEVIKTDEPGAKTIGLDTPFQVALDSKSSFTREITLNQLISYLSEVKRKVDALPAEKRAEQIQIFENYESSTSYGFTLSTAKRAIDFFNKSVANLVGQKISVGFTWTDQAIDVYSTVQIVIPRSSDWYSKLSVDRLLVKLDIEQFNQKYDYQNFEKNIAKVFREKEVRLNKVLIDSALRYNEWITKTEPKPYFGKIICNHKDLPLGWGVDIAQFKNFLRPRYACSGLSAQQVEEFKTAAAVDESMMTYFKAGGGLLKMYGAFLSNGFCTVMIEMNVKTGAVVQAYLHYRNNIKSVRYFEAGVAVPSYELVYVQGSTEPKVKIQGQIYSLIPYRAWTN